jgi:hypothetical protein
MRFAEAMEEGASGDRLNGFPQAHLIGEEGALGEREVEHPFALVREEWQECLMCGMAAGGDTGFVIAAADDSVVRDRARGEPRGGVERDAELREAGRSEFGDEAGGIELGKLKAREIEASAEAAWKLVEIAFDAETTSGVVGHEVDARGGLTTAGGVEFVAMPTGQVLHNGFDMLAGAEAVDAKIGAGTSCLTAGDIANLDTVIEPAGRVYLEVRKDGMCRCEVGHARAFLSSAELTLEDFVGIGRAPVGDGWKEAGGVGAADAAGHAVSEGRPHA